MDGQKFSLRPKGEDDAAWIAARMRSDWGGERMAVHGKVYWPAELAGWVAETAAQSIGLLTYHIEADACEIVTLNAWHENQGVGTALIEAVMRSARQAGCRRLWLITTNDNTPALRFYQKRGFHISGIRVNGVAEGRKLKPEIPSVGMDGIEIRDEIELEMGLSIKIKTPTSV